MSSYYLISTKKLTDKLNKEFGGKLSGKPFTQPDISNYLKRGYIPWRYGGDLLVRGDKRGQIKVSKRKINSKK